MNLVKNNAKINLLLHTILKKEMYCWILKNKCRYSILLQIYIYLKEAYNNSSIQLFK
ncbi:hypothetical protein KFK09_003338 [Dendrobium nobile]|uniref:Uncharacterized protein n=1 Tax=Dendrobium nobile TaxID=94219 RepID=A0A8T3BZZ0_DENNO|nr:hypothetical protein KFK09_003338 [Dendrobium nobile]